jgi:hypothetical protein
MQHLEVHVGDGKIEERKMGITKLSSEDCKDTSSSEA